MRLLVKKLDNRIYFRLIGELDDRSSQDVRDKIDYVLDHDSYDAVVFDLKELTFMDSTGIGIIIGRYKRLKPKGKDIYVMSPNRQVDKILSTTGLYQIVKRA